MNDGYQIGSDIEWLKHSNDELNRTLKQTQRSLSRCRAVAFLSLAALGWVVYQFSQVRPLQELWPF